MTKELIIQTFQNEPLLTRLNIGGDWNVLYELCNRATKER